MGDLVALDLEQVAASDLDPIPLGGRTGEQPLRAAPVAADPVTVLAIVDVGAASEAAGAYPITPSSAGIWSMSSPAFRRTSQLQ